MPLQNRVTPFGEIVVSEFRGTLMGNRSCLHDDSQRIRRPFALKRWIVCVLAFRGRKRTIMSPNRYTELFFLDEATAFAAGHRPCAECQHARYQVFRRSWPSVGTLPTANAMDVVLHAERMDATGGKRTYSTRLSQLPTGTMVADAQYRPFLVLGHALVPWQPGGYGPPIAKAVRQRVQVLTPPSIVGAVMQGFPVGIHASAHAN